MATRDVSEKKPSAGECLRFVDLDSPVAADAESKFELVVAIATETCDRYLGRDCGQSLPI